MATSPSPLAKAQIRSWAARSESLLGGFSVERTFPSESVAVTVNRLVFLDPELDFSMVLTGTISTRTTLLLAEHKELAAKLDALERKYDKQFGIVFEAIRQMMAPPSEKKRRIGFIQDE